MVSTPVKQICKQHTCKIHANGTGSFFPPIALSFAGSYVITSFTPTINPPPLNFPTAIKPNTTTSTEPKTSKIPLIVSDTATALIPPSTAYSAPIIPTSTIRIVSAIPSLIPNTVAKSKICSNAIAPAYRHTGIPITKYPIRNRIETIRRTPTPYLSSINSGSVVYPFLRYIGKTQKP